LEKLY